MSLDNIQLPGWVIANLYRNTLVETDEPWDPEKPIMVQHSLRFLGSNGKQIVFVVHAGNAVFLPDHQLGFITRMLDACKMNLADVAILNLAGSATGIAQILEELEPVVLILFGPEPQSIGLPFNIPVFKIQAHGNCQFLFAPALELLLPDTEESKMLKSKLWVCLKALFGI